MRSDNSNRVEPETSDIESAFKHALVLHQTGRLDEAWSIYQQILGVQPRHFGSIHMLGVIDLQKGRPAEAIQRFDAALELNPNSAEAFNNRGTTLRVLKRPNEALANHDKAIALKSDYAEALANRGNALIDMKRFEEALTSLDRAIAIKPGYAEAFNSRGKALLELSRLDEALASLDRAIAIYPGHADAFNNRGTVLMELQRMADALASYDKAIALKSDYAGALYNRAIALRELDRLDEALVSFDQALAIEPGYAAALSSRGMLKLLLGYYRDGLSDYEWRWKTEHHQHAPTINAKNWQGNDLRNRSIAVYTELHLGDVIQFARYLPLLRRRGALVTFLAPPRLIRLLKSLTPRVTLTTWIEHDLSFDFKCALMSLPHWFGTELSSIPNETPYLSAESGLVAAWRRKIGKEGFKIGIAWQGRPQRTRDRRQFALADIMPLTRLPGTRFISLQKNEGVDQLNDLSTDTNIETLGEFDSGPDAFVDTAAVMENLDLVITSDTSIAHLAGALGRPTWVALRRTPDWRWLLDRDDCPWYPTIRLFRQTTRDDWEAVFSKMKEELQLLLLRSA